MNRILYVHKIHTALQEYERRRVRVQRVYKSRRECIDAPRANINFKWVSFRLFSPVTLDGEYTRTKTSLTLLDAKSYSLLHSVVGTPNIFHSTPTNAQRQAHTEYSRWLHHKCWALLCVKIFCANENGKYATYYTFKCGHIAIGAVYGGSRALSVANLSWIHIATMTVAPSKLRFCITPPSSTSVDERKTNGRNRVNWMSEWERVKTCWK